jgi:predicted flap endonuclease-1-like 5' DNA nuclease
LNRNTTITVISFMVLLFSLNFPPVVNASSFPFDPETFTLLTALAILIVIAAAIAGALIYRRYNRKQPTPPQASLTGAEYCPTCGRPLHIISEPIQETKKPAPTKETDEEWIKAPRDTKTTPKAKTVAPLTEPAVAKKAEPQVVADEPVPSTACPICGASISKEDELCMYCGAPLNIMSVPIIKIEGVGQVYSDKLSEFGIKTTKDLLEQGRTPKGRRELAEKTDISPKLILEWVNRADLIRIKGVSEEYSDLLESSGVDTVVELSRRNPDNLQKKMIEVNDEKKLVRRVPKLNQVKEWVEQAKKLPRIIEY